MAEKPAFDTRLHFTARRVLSSMRQTLEQLYRAQIRRSSPTDQERLKALLLVLESIRLTMAPYEAIGPVTSDRADFLELLTGLRALISNADFIEYGRSVRFRLSPVNAGDERRFLSRKSFEDKTILEAASALIELMEARLQLARSEDVAVELRELRQVVPEQKIAPVQFYFRNDRVAVLQTKSKPDEEDQDNVAAAKQQLQSAGERILQELARSNCDKRLIESVKYLQDQLSHDGNVVQIGLSNLTCEAMCHAFQAELPDAVAAMLTAHTRGVELYVGQFPEWHRFAENAASTQLDQADVTILSEAASALVAKLELKPELAEPEVPETIKRINQLLKSPARAGKRAAFAMLRTLENLVSRVFSHSIEFLEMTANKTKEKVSSAIAHGAVIVLLSIALEGAASISSVAGKVTEAQWLKTAVTIVQKQLQRIGN